MSNGLCPGCGKREAGWIGIELSGAYDGILIWECRLCGIRWPRFQTGTRLHDLAAEIIEKWEEVPDTLGDAPEWTI